MNKRLRDVSARNPVFTADELKELSASITRYYNRRFYKKLAIGFAIAAILSAFVSWGLGWI